MPTTGAPNFNVESEVARDKLVVLADISEQTGEWDYAEAIWEPQGYRQEDGSLEANYDTTTAVDILSITHVDVTAGAETMDFDPNTLRRTSRYGRFNEIIHEQDWRKDVTALTNHRFLVVAGYISVAGGYQAKVYDKCAAVPNSHSGSGGGKLGLPYTLTLAGQTIFGSASAALPPMGDLTKDSVVFTPEA